MVQTAWGYWIEASYLLDKREKDRGIRKCVALLGLARGEQDFQAGPHLFALETLISQSEGFLNIQDDTLIRMEDTLSTIELSISTQYDRELRSLVKRLEKEVKKIENGTRGIKRFTKKDQSPN